jgi:hypothetical protein
LIYKTSIPRLLSEQIQFYLNSEIPEDVPNLNATKLTAVGSIKVSKMARHIVENKMFTLPKNEKGEEIPPEECVEIM